MSQDEKAPFLPYGRQIIDDDDIAAVVRVLRSDWLTTGPNVERFEADVCAFTGANHGVAVCNGTAALHAAVHALGIGPGDEVVVPPMTFAASANCVLYCGATPVFADVDAGTLLLDPAAAEAAITPRTRAIIAVDYAGQPCDWDALRALADRHGLALVADACHSIGGTDKGRKVGTLADVTVFSFHPVKHVTTGEGGMCLTDDAELAHRMRTFRNHGITTDARQREKAGGWFYEMTDLGFNYRITDIQCALGSSQLGKLPGWLARRRELAAAYDAALTGSSARPLARRADTEHAYHLYVVRHPVRDEAFKRLRGNGVGANVHYVPVHLHPYYRERLGTHEGLCPAAEAAYREILSLPLWPGMSRTDVGRVARLLD
ncbi:UDP-4-keto-6-deoxy-N-acetylglucosamine 4-aminotransferase [Desulfovibrio sp. X2]|uniref:UDP-4-amino-4, 6-dideoxy-N-acetyl-beta-L-altrosamine transaminase n=1 Tax=Desulfovibrio sp. X2 TaxID=941449 RepID=UPI000358D423|nr:UDP-4-amino-4,6-dideoxy-N-acetyl-beta-L-altrosamine transaminase [Desulfovibrio sp. X2]EPR37163.1 UDP-4-keto-6-deoxy-N-acetylglucosamine 4-aminotransferase [Desulfovibrio sp. X2]